MQKMAELLFHYSAQIASRADGRSSVGMAAYRAGQALHDERTGETYDYRRRNGVVDGGISLPFVAPAWAADRELLWQSVEAAEKRRDAQLVSEVNVAIPYGLDDAQAVALIQEYSAWLSDRDETAVGWDIHRDDPKSHDGQTKKNLGLHAHLMRPLRRLTRDGFGEKIISQKKFKGAAAIREAKRRLQEEREVWATMANRHLALAGIDATIDHRSHADRGLVREATIHLGVAVAAMERRGVQTAAGDLNREITERNRKRRIEHESKFAVGDIEDSDALEARKARFKAQLLSEHYQTEISELLGQRLAYVDLGPPVSRISLKDGGRLYDHGARITAGSGTASEIHAMLEIATAKQWTRIRFSGSDEFVMAAALAAMRAGRFAPDAVSARDPHQAHLIGSARQTYLAGQAAAQGVQAPQATQQASQVASHAVLRIPQIRNAATPAPIQHVPSLSDAEFKAALRRAIGDRFAQRLIESHKRVTAAEEARARAESERQEHLAGDMPRFLGRQAWVQRRDELTTAWRKTSAALRSAHAARNHLNTEVQAFSDGLTARSPEIRDALRAIERDEATRRVAVQAAAHQQCDSPSGVRHPTLVDLDIPLAGLRILSGLHAGLKPSDAICQVIQHAASTLAIWRDPEIVSRAVAALQAHAVAAQRDPGVVPGWMIDAAASLLDQASASTSVERARATIETARRDPRAGLMQALSAALDAVGASDSGGSTRPAIRHR